MTGAMTEKTICLPNRKTRMMKLIQPQFKSIMKSKVIINITTHQYKNLKVHSRSGTTITRIRHKILYLILEHVCVCFLATSQYTFPKL